MTNLALVALVCRLPIAVRVHPDRALTALLEDARQGGGGPFPTEEELATELMTHPELIEPWIQLSEDQRVSAGWYLRRLGDGSNEGWEVGFYPTSGHKIYQSKFAATAAFISRYIGGLPLDK
jgi:hypothetical protein